MLLCLKEVPNRESQGEGEREGNGSLMGQSEHIIFVVGLLFYMGPVHGTPKQL